MNLCQTMPIWRPPCIVLAKKGTVLDGQLNVKKPFWKLSANCRMLPSLLFPRWEYLLSWTVMTVTRLEVVLSEVQSGKERIIACCTCTFIG